MRRRFFNLASVVSLVLVSVTVNCCQDAPSEQPARRNSATQSVEAITEAIRIGEQRVFDPSGPKFKLDDFLYHRVTSNPEISKPKLEEKLRSTDAAIRCNAYDFIAHFIEIPEEREWAMRHIRAGLNDSGMVKNFVGSVLHQRELAERNT